MWSRPNSFLAASKLSSIAQRCAFHCYPFFQSCTKRTPGREEGEIAVGDVAADQQPAGPEVGESRVEIIGVKISEIEKGPVM